MRVPILGASLEVEIFGPEGAPLLIAHHGGGGIGSLAEPKTTFGPLADLFRVLVFDARGCGRSEGVPPYSHAQWAADVDALREWAGAEQCVVAGGSYGGFICLEYAVAHPERVLAMVLRDTAADSSNLALAYENARRQNRVEINWEHFERYWSGQVRDDAEKSAAAVEAGIYRHESHNWCFQHNLPNYDLKPQLPTVRCPTLVTVGRTDWVTPVSAAQTIADLLPDARLVVFERSGHSPQIEERDLFQATVREFLLDAVPQAAGARP